MVQVEFGTVFVTYSVFLTYIYGHSHFSSNGNETLKQKFLQLMMIDEVMIKDPDFFCKVRKVFSDIFFCILAKALEKEFLESNILR